MKIVNNARGLAFIPDQRLRNNTENTQLQLTRVAAEQATIRVKREQKKLQ